MPLAKCRSEVKTTPQLCMDSFSLMALGSHVGFHVALALKDFAFQSLHISFKEK